MFGSTHDTENRSAASKAADHEVDLRVTQAQIDNEAIVALDVPNLASLEIAIPSATQDGFRIRIPDACADGSAIVAHVHVVAECESHNKTVEGAKAQFDEQTHFCSACEKQVKVDDDFRCTECQWPV